MSISDWPVTERPRERLLESGAQVLADAELLAICLRTGIQGKSAVELARDLIGAFGSVRALLASSAKELSRHRGLGNAKAAQLLASVELARRSLREEVEACDALTSPQALKDYLRLMLAAKDREVFVVVMLDAQHHVKASEELFHGTLTQTSVYPREVVKCALRHNAAAVIFAHNHPSGIAEPSYADELLTRTLKSALALVDIQVLDHVIVAGGRTLSFAERGLL
ncbi:MAG: DNA repair protein RadC [Burkholderiales bacterium]